MGILKIKELTMLNIEEKKEDSVIVQKKTINMWISSM